jgi:AraC family transcriptional regulator
VGVHPAHRGRAFRRHFGCTPGDYVRGLRAEVARRRLATSDGPLVVVALAVGYSDPTITSPGILRNCQTDGEDTQRRC